MDLRRLGIGEWIAALGGVALLVSLFLPWYGLDAACVRAPCPADSWSGWRALAVTDVVLALLAAAAVATCIVTAAQRVQAVPIAMDSLLVLAALGGVVLVLIRVSWTPDDAPERAVGLWLGLAGSVAITAGALIAMRDERRGIEPAPELEPVPPPQPPGGASA